MNHPFTPSSSPSSSPLNPKQEPQSDVSPPSSSRKRPRPRAAPKPRFQGILEERERRLSMKQLLATLESMLPNLQSKATRTNVVGEAIEYIKLLEGVVGEMEERKKSIQGGDGITYTSESPNVSVVVSGEMAVFGICLDAGRCLVTKALMVFEEYNVDVLAANVALDDSVLKLSVTAFVGGGRREVVEMIKGEIEGLISSTFE